MIMDAWLLRRSCSLKSQEYWKVEYFTKIPFFIFLNKMIIKLFLQEGWRYDFLHISRELTWR